MTKFSFKNYVQTRWIYNNIAFSCCTDIIGQTYSFIKICESLTRSKLVLINADGQAEQTELL